VLATTGAAGSLLAIVTDSLIQAGVFALGALVLRIGEFGALTTALRRRSR
jgi:hypothetical protein